LKKIDTIRWGIIGVGNVTEIKSGPSFYKTEHSRLVAVMRRNAEKAADYARRHGVPKWYSDASELINDPEVDAVYVATPPNSHAKYAIEVMKAGKPVYVEKPMGRNYAECLEMIKTSEETGMPLRVAYYKKTLEAYIKVKELIEGGAIGKPLIANIKLYKPATERNLSHDKMSWHVFPEISGGGHFFDLACHQLDYLDFLFGPVTRVSGTASNNGGLYPAEDTVTGAWKHESGVTGTGSWCFLVDESLKKDEIEIIGERGRLIFPFFTYGTVILHAPGGEEIMKFKKPQHIAQPLIRLIVNEFRGFGEPASTGVDGARTNRVMDEMVKNYYPEKQK